MNREELDHFEKLVGQMQSTYDEMSVLSRKSPKDAVNKFKLQFVNRLLRKSNEFLGRPYHPFDDFTEFDEDDMPLNSDVVFMISQYLQCFEKLRADNVVMRHGTWWWMLEPDEGESADDDGYVRVRTVAPKRLRS